MDYTKEIKEVLNDNSSKHKIILNFKKKAWELCREQGSIDLNTKPKYWSDVLFTVSLLETNKLRYFFLTKKKLKKELAFSLYLLQLVGNYTVITYEKETYKIMKDNFEKKFIKKSDINKLTN